MSFTARFLHHSDSAVQCNCDLTLHVRLRQAPNNRPQPYSRISIPGYSAAEKRRNKSQLSAGLHPLIGSFETAGVHSSSDLADLLRYPCPRYSAFRQLITVRYISSRKSFSMDKTMTAIRSRPRIRRTLTLQDTTHHIHLTDLDSLDSPSFLASHSDKTTIA